jgi:hypothetical protein
MPTCLNGGSAATTVTTGMTTGVTYTPLVANFDGDANADIAFWASGSSVISEWRSGTSTVNVTTGMVSGTAYLPLVGDFDGDVKSDIASWPNASANLQVALGSGSVVSVFVFGSARNPAVGDFNGDGYDDIYGQRKSDGYGVANCFLPGAAVPQPGPWHFGTALYASQQVGLANAVPRVINVNGAPDALVIGSAANAAGTVQWLAGKHQATSGEWPFNAAAPVQVRNTLHVVDDVLIADFNGDAIDDIAW